jgi:membrane glycosyltransferase
MLDRSAALIEARTDAVVSLAGRRALYFSLVGATIAGLLWLAAIAVPPRSLGAVAFLALFAVTLPWSAIGFWNACIGFVVMRCASDPVAAVNPLAASIGGDEEIVASTAILMCVRNEAPAQVIRNLRPMLDDLTATQAASRFHLYVLSDTDEPALIAVEQSSFEALAADRHGAIPITYRRRAINAGFKAGNIRDFCVRWGADHDFAITFDADSFMPADAVLRIVRLMQANPRLGILQTLSIGMPSMSAFARLFQFGMRLGMHAHTLGAAWWQGDCGPYWGHNAILRLKPFIADCAIADLPADGPLGGSVLSHDQIEAALMRRAGFEVRVLPIEGMSWEENPPTLLEFIRRELRWCHGNMQYWRLLATPGLKPVSRFQLVFAILMYLGSPAWMALIGLGVGALALAQETSAPIGFAGPGALLFAIMLAMIFAPKIATCLDVLARPELRRAYGGAAPFLSNVAAEILFSSLLAPVMALAHTLFLFRLFVLRRGAGWNSQNRESHALSWRRAWARLWPQTLAGIVIFGIVAAKAPRDLAFAAISAAGLALAAPFAVATASPWLGALFSRIGVGRIPEETEPRNALARLGLPAIEAARFRPGRS